MFKKRNFLFGIIFVFIVGFTLISPISLLFAQQAREKELNSSQIFNNGTITLDQNFQVLENTEDYQNVPNEDSVPINLGSSRWNISDLQLDINNMKFINETKTIEDEYTDDYSVSKNAPGYKKLAIQLKIVVPTILYGVYIYGENVTTSELNENISFELQGYDPISGTPNETIIQEGDIPLNMSKSRGLGWHFQEFNKPISLSKGSYSFVLNGEVLNDPKSVYNWYCNENHNPNNLNASFYVSGSWSPGTEDTLFLYKLKQKVNDTFHPSEINMTAKINGKDYQINDTNEKGSGNLSISLNFFPNETIMDIPITNNVSNGLIFNVSYFIKLKNSLSCSGSVSIKKEQNNIWAVNPIFSRYGYNYSVIYDYPDHWDNIKVYRNGEEVPIGAGVVDDESFLYIQNETISDGDTWQIEATSPRFDLTIDPGPKTSYTTGEKLSFWIEDLPNKGTYTFIFVDNIHAVEYTEVKEKTDLERFTFNYTIPSTAPDGEWIAYVSWNNETDAGLQTQTFTITRASNGGGPFIDPIFLITLFVIIGSVSGVGIASFVVVKKVLKKRELRKKRLRTKVLDILNLRDIIIISTKTGLNVYDEHYSGKSVDATLVSGFLEAIRSFGIELTGSQEQTQSISLMYQDLIVVMSEFKDVRLLVVMKDKPSKHFQESIDKLSVEIEEQYGDEVRDELAQKKSFYGIHKLIKKHLHTSFVLPLQIKQKKDVKLSTDEKDLVKKAKHIMKKRNQDHFFSSFLLSEEKLNVDQIELIFDLLEKGVFEPIQINSNKELNSYTK